MTFVVFSWNFVPQNDPEAFCTTRFASALAAEGHDVCVVTPEREPSISDATIRQLLDHRVRVVRFRIPAFFRSRFWRFWDVRLRFNTWTTFFSAFASRSLLNILDMEKGAILVTRSAPDISAYVGYRCRRHAHRWVAHFSDPFPYFFTCRTRRDRFIYRRSIQWGRKILNAADAISVTCANVLSVFQQRYGADFEANKRKFVVVPHIGNPLLVPDQEAPALGAGSILHCGALTPERYRKELADELCLLKGKGDQFRFLLAGSMPAGFSAQLGGKGIVCSQIRLVDPSETTSLYRQASICLVVDTKGPYSTSPYCPSKFVYQLFSDCPIVVFTTRGSAMDLCAKRYPDAGIWTAHPEVKGELAESLHAALASGRRFDAERENARRSFFSKNVASSFVDFVRKMN